MRTVSVLLAVLLLTTACGVGGGGSDDTTPTLPGTLRIVALEGASAPDGGGTFEAFPTQTLMDTASGGWSVFVANTTDRGQAVYAFTPDRALYLVYAEGDTPPDLVTGEIDDFEGVWINENGVVVVLFDGEDDTPAGLLSAEVSEGGVMNRESVIFLGRDMSDTGVTGDLDGIDAGFTFLRSNDAVFFRGFTDAGETALFRAETDGSDIDALVGSNSDLPGAAVVAHVHAVGVDRTGAGFAFIAEHADAGGTRGIYTGTVGTSTYGSVAIEGDPLLDTDVLETLPDEQPLIVYSGTAGVTVMYKAESDANEDHLIFGIPDETDQLVVREGDADTQITGGLFGALEWLENDASANAAFRANMSGAQGVTFAIFGFRSTGQFQRELLGYNGGLVPGDSSQRLGNTWPGLGVVGHRDVATNGDAAYANVLDPGGDTALFLADRSQGQYFLVARTGRTIPGGGDEFGVGTAWRQTLADGSLLFRAPVDGAGSGLFRQGP